MLRSFYTLIAVTACNSKNVVTDAQCSDVEQGMFIACLSSDCSATYEQSLSGADACSVEGGGSVIHVDAGARCGFTSSGSCYVVCDCPDGTSFEYTLDEENYEDNTDLDNENNYEGDQDSECIDRIDNDRDGLYDCSDPDCSGSPDCQQDEGSDTGLNHYEDSDTGYTSEDSGGDLDTDRDGYTILDGDCNDNNPVINPASTDIVGDSIDQNCDGVDGTDVDRDGFASEASGGDDCDDFDIVVNPDYGIWDESDYVDSNCDGEDGLNWTYKSLTLSYLYTLTVGDFDGDGKDDLVLYETRTYDVCIIFGSSITSFSGNVMSASDCDVLTDFEVQGFSVGDVDSDGKDDLLYGLYGTNTGYLFFGSTIATATVLWPGSNDDISISAGWGTLSYFQIVEDVSGDSIDDIVAITYTYSSGYPYGTYYYYTNILASPFSRSSLTVTTDRLASLTGTYASEGITVLPLDTNHNGKMDFLFDRGYADVSTSKRNFSVFFPTDVLPDIDGDGNDEITDGNCIQNANNYSDSSFCDYYASYTLTARQLADLEGAGVKDDYFYCSRIPSSGYYECNIKKDILAAGGSDVHIHGGFHDFRLHSGDFDGDGKDEIIASDSSSANIIGIK